MMTPSQYEQRYREMLQRNAHNLSVAEIECLAYGAGVPVTQMLAAQMAELDIASRREPDDSIEHAIDAAREFMR